MFADLGATGGGLETMAGIVGGAMGGVVIFGFVLGGGLRTRVGRVIMIALFFLISSLGTHQCRYKGSRGCYTYHHYDCADYNTPEGQICKDFNGLSDGYDYYWKVVASDGRGGIAESAVWKFSKEEGDFKSADPDDYLPK
jgi:hypothetical protein